MLTNDEQKRAAFQWIRERAERKHGKHAEGTLVMAPRVMPHAPAEQTMLLIGHPEMLGDDYEEIIESLNRLADAHLALVIVPRAGRDSEEVDRLADEDSWPAPDTQGPAPSGVGS
jgi:hypothetical protein